MLNPEDEDLLEPLIAEIKKDPDILGVILYGSAACNKSYRDIDVCLVVYPAKNPLPLQKVLFYKGNFSSRVDVHFFNDLPLYIQSRVLDEGKILFNRNFDALFDLYEATIRAYTDFYPHFRHYLEVD